MKFTCRRPLRLARDVAVLFAALWSSSPVWAQNASNASPQATQLQACTQLADNAQRLACFDQAMATATTGEAPSNTPANELSNESLTQSSTELSSELSTALPALGQDTSTSLYQHAGNQVTSWFDRRWELSPDTKSGTFQIRPYKPVYLLPFFYSAKLNQQPTSPNPVNQVTAPLDIQREEMKFQLSLKTKVAENLLGDNGDIWFGYTQSSRWQVYNSAASRPFRETNYEPEVMFTWRTSWSEFTDLTGWNPRMLGLSLNHQSNGRSLPLSRSWNRLIGVVGLERQNTLFQVRPWKRLPEKSTDDDNPNISDTMGRIDYLLVHKQAGHEYSVLARHNNRMGSESRGAVQLDWAFPIQSSLRGHVQFFSGYGESLIDYNHRSDYLGLGVSLIGWY